VVAVAVAGVGNSFNCMCVRQKKALHYVRLIRGGGGNEGSTFSHHCFQWPEHGPSAARYTMVCTKLNSKAWPSC
jgi:hypothetical protein